MGVNIHLYINFTGIEQEQWESVYNESLILLDKFPAPLMRLDAEKKYGSKRYVYTSNIRLNAGTAKESWRVSGDLSSYRRAETFELFRDMGRHAGSHKGDILWANEDEINYPQGNGVDIFGGKTQGCPYHLAVLAVTILIESRFPNNAYAFGDIDGGQVKPTLRWMNTILEQPAIPSICVDAERLWTRADAVFPDKNDALKRFRALYRGTTEEELQTLIELCDIREVRSAYREELSRYSSLKQLGAEKIVRITLGVLQDIDQLIEFVCPEKAGEQDRKFPLEELLDVLCKNFITIAFQEREPLSLLSRKTGTLETIDEIMERTFMLMRGMPTKVNFHITGPELLELFCRYENNKRKTFKKIIKKNDADCRKKLHEVEKTIQELKQRVEKSQADTEEDSEKSNPEIVIPGSKEEKFIIEEVRSQIEHFDEPEKTTAVTGKQLRSMIKENGQFPETSLTSLSRQDLLSGIIKATHQLGFALRESAWAEIDKEENIEILQALLLLALVDSREMNFWHWRIYVLEHKELWPLLI
ncbi:MAG: hypothetical protein GY754_46735 [bacterium]|nr:hypothetical protein [bacterium]